MDIEEKLELNKVIRKYVGDNLFIKSLQTSLRSKWCDKVKVGNKNYKILSDRQYEAAKTNF
jgi:hypothetical protein